MNLDDNMVYADEMSEILLNYQEKKPNLIDNWNTNVNIDYAAR